ncbi:unnamed protein product [Coregonus sp. 'balchen']|nr:unnamed protein product [Coregonus sp. 'balchen']
MNPKSAEFFDMLGRMQQDDYIPYPRIEDVSQPSDTIISAGSKHYAHTSVNNTNPHMHAYIHTHTCRNANTGGQCKGSNNIYRHIYDQYPKLLFISMALFLWMVMSWYINPLYLGCVVQILEKGSPYPQVILPQFGGYWIEDAEAPAGTPTSSESSFCEEDDGGDISPGGGFGFRLECNSTARAYRKHFLSREHMNYYCTGSSLGNLIMSLKHEEAEGQEFLRIMLRSRTKTHHDRISLAGLNQLPSVPQIAKVRRADLII